jgi:hypothetical protein
MVFRRSKLGAKALCVARRRAICADQQTIDELTAMRRLGDREDEAITRRSYGCGPVIRPRPGPFER